MNAVSFKSSYDHDASSIFLTQMSKFQRLLSSIASGGESHFFASLLL